MTGAELRTAITGPAAGRRAYHPGRVGAVYSGIAL
jgi:hypothetical protein